MTGAAKPRRRPDRQRAAPLDDDDLALLLRQWQAEEDARMAPVFAELAEQDAALAQLLAEQQAEEDTLLDLIAAQQDAEAAALRALLDRD